MTVQFQKKPNNNHVLSCLRHDGTATWQTSKSPFLVFHDLTHFAIETTLGIPYGFYGILSAGWDIDDFGTPWPKGKIPVKWVSDALFAEHLTGAFDRERDSNLLVTVEAINTLLAQSDHDCRDLPTRTITEEDIREIRNRCAELFQQWNDLNIGESLHFTFRASDSFEFETDVSSSRWKGSPET